MAVGYGAGRRRLVLVAGVALAASSLVEAGPRLPAAAISPCPTGAALVVAPSQVQAIDPFLTVSGLVAPASVNPRHYDEIVQVSFYPHQLIGSDFYLKACIQTNAPQPSWPTTPAGDTGSVFEVCGDPTESPGLVGQDAVQIGAGASGPIFDGPYNPEEGWKGCAIAGFGVGQVGTGPIDTGWKWQSDPADGSTGQLASGFLDGNNGLHIVGASWVGNAVTMYVPETLQWMLAPTPTAPALGVSEVVFNQGHTQNLVAEVFASTSADLPVPVCPAFGDCAQNLQSVGTLVHWAPGGQLGVPATHVPGIDLGILGDVLPPGPTAPTACADADLAGSDDPGPAPLHEAAPNPGQNLLPAPLSSNCVLLAGTTPVPWAYEAHNGGLTGHDLPCVQPQGLALGGPACYHLTRVWDYTGNGV